MYVRTLRPRGFGAVDLPGISPADAQRYATEAGVPVAAAASVGKQIAAGMKIAEGLDLVTLQNQVAQKAGDAAKTQAAAMLKQAGLPPNLADGIVGSSYNVLTGNADPWQVAADIATASAAGACSAAFTPVGGAACGMLASLTVKVFHNLFAGDEAEQQRRATWAKNMAAAKGDWAKLVSTNAELERRIQSTYQQLVNDIIKLGLSNTMAVGCDIVLVPGGAGNSIFNVFVNKTLANKESVYGCGNTSLYRKQLAAVDKAYAAIATLNPDLSAAAGLPSSAKLAASSFDGFETDYGQSVYDTWRAGKPDAPVPQDVCMMLRGPLWPTGTSSVKRPPITDFMRLNTALLTAQYAGWFYIDDAGNCRHGAGANCCVDDGDGGCPPTHPSSYAVAIQGMTNLVRAKIGLLSALVRGGTNLKRQILAQLASQAKDEALAYQASCQAAQAGGAAAAQAEQSGRALQAAKLPAVPASDASAWQTYLNTALGTGLTSGTVDAATVAATKRFQVQNQLPQTGKLDAATLAKANAGKASASGSSSGSSSLPMLLGLAAVGAGVWWWSTRKNSRKTKRS